VSQSPQSGQWHSYHQENQQENQQEKSRLNPLNRVNGILINTVNYIQSFKNRLNPLNRVNGILIKENLERGKHFHNVSIPSIGSMAFLFGIPSPTTEVESWVSIPSIGSMAFLLIHLTHMYLAMSRKSQSPQSGQWHSYEFR